MRGKGRLAAQHLIRLHVDATHNRVPAFDEGDIVVVLLDHVVGLDRAIVGIAHTQESENTEIRETLVRRRKGLQPLDAEALHEAGRARALGALLHVVVTRERKSGFIEQARTKCVGPA